MTGLTKQLFGSYERSYTAEDALLVQGLLWMANAGTFVNLHMDAVHNFFLQVYGRKKILLLPPC